MSEYFWGIYRLLHNPPGTPRELKCVGCKMAVAGALFAGGGGILYSAKRSFRPNVYKASFLGGIGSLFIAGALISVRLGYEHHKYNEMLKKEFTENARKLRIENKIINSH